MKIIFITREGYRLPGSRIRCYNFAKELARYGIDTQVLSFSDTLGAKDGENEAQLKLADKIRFNYKAFRLLAKDKKAVFYIQRFNYHSFAPYLAHLFNKNRIILDLDDWEMRENPRYYFGFYPSSKAHYFTRKIAKASIACIAASRFLEKFLSQFNTKVYYLPSGVDTQVFKPNTSTLNPEKIVFSWIGTLHKREYIDNLEFAVGCFSQLRDRYSHIYFGILGDGIYRDDLVRLIKGYNDEHIFLKGRLAPGLVPTYLDNINIGLCPVAKVTKFNQAKSPTKLFEYMAMAKPTVSSAVGETPHIIHDRDNGFLAKTREEFVEKMKSLIEDSSLRKRMGERARENVVERYSLEILGKRLHEILIANAT